MVAGIMFAIIAIVLVIIGIKNSWHPGLIVFIGIMGLTLFIVGITDYNEYRKDPVAYEQKREEYQAQQKAEEEKRESEERWKRIKENDKIIREMQHENWERKWGNRSTKNN